MDHIDLHILSGQTFSYLDFITKNDIYPSKSIQDKITGLQNIGHIDQHIL